MFYGLLEEVIEVAYRGVGRCVVILFKCKWFDATSMEQRGSSKYIIILDFSLNNMLILNVVIVEVIGINLMKLDISCSYFTNTLILPAVNGPTEGLALIYVAHFFTAIVGMQLLVAYNFLFSHVTVYLSVHITDH